MATTITPSPIAAMLAGRAAQQQRGMQAQTQSTTTTTPTIAGGPREWAQQLSRSVNSHRNSMVEIAYYARLLRESNGWQEAGFEDESHCRRHHAMNEGTWNEYIKLGQRLSQLSLEEMRQLTQSAAKQLTRVHPKIWPEYAWVEEAKFLPAGDFQQLVDQRNHEVAPTAVAEPKAKLTVQMPISQRKKIEKRLEQFRRSASLPSAAAALDDALSAAEHRQAILANIDRLESAVTELAALWRPDQPWSTGLQEALAEQMARHEGPDGDLDRPAAPTSLSEAAAQSQVITRRLIAALKDLYVEVLPETPSAG